MDVLHSCCRRAEKPWTLEFRSSKAFVVAVVAIAFFAVSIAYECFSTTWSRFADKLLLGCLHILDGETHRETTGSNKTLNWFNPQVVPLLPAILRERAHLPDDQRTSMSHHAITEGLN